MTKDEYLKNWIGGELKLDERIALNKYASGALHVIFYHEGCDGLTLSTNIEGVSDFLKPGHFCVKDWSENRPLAKAAMDSGLFEDTGMLIPTGHVTSAIWRIK